MNWFQKDDQNGEASLLADMTRQSPEGRLITDRDGTVVFVNAAFVDLLGRVPGHLSDLAAAAAEGETGMRTLAALMAKALGTTSATAEVAFRTDEASVRWLALRAMPVGRPVTHVGWDAADVTPQRELQDVLHQEQARLTDLIEHAPVGVLSLDKHGRVQMVNATMADWLGYPVEELTTGAEIEQVAGEAAAVLRPTEEALDGGPATFDLTLRRRDGDSFDVEAMQSVVRDSDDGGLRTRTVVRKLPDGTGEAAPEPVVEDKFHSFLEHAPVAVLLVDRDGRIEEANAAFRHLLAAGSDNLSGRMLGDFVSAEERGRLESLLQRTWDGETLKDPIDLRLTGGKAQRAVELYASTLADEAGTVSGLLLHMVDTTKQRDLEIQFAQSQKMQAVGQLAGGVAHDFNNLLTAIIGHCDLLLLRARPGDESFPDIMQIKQNANRAANLIRQLLAFSRQQTLRPKVLSLTDVLAELTHLVRRLIGETIELKIEHGRDLGLVKVDQGQFEQVIINLAVNARDAMPDGGVLEIHTSNISYEESKRVKHDLMQPGDYVLVEVADTGTGILKEDLGRIFEPFFTTKGPGGGTGLGLSTVFGIVKQTGGYIFPESEPGQGTTFKIYLPVHQVEASEQAKGAEEPEEAPRDLTGAGTVLLVEDEDAVRMFAARALKSKGYTVLEAHDGEAALELFNQHGGNIDILVSDVVMPNMDGPTLLREVRKQRPELKVIFVSGYAEDAFRKNLDPDSEFELLPKPFSLKQLAARVKEMLGG